MKQYLSKVFARKSTPQTQPVPGTNQVRNSAGGYSFSIDPWQRLNRFLVLGSEGGSYYASQATLTLENANAVKALIEEDGQRVVREIVAISAAGRAPKNDPAIFALAMAASFGDLETRRAALDALPQVCRTATHLFSFAEAIKGMRGWGRGLRRAVAQWYTARAVPQLAYQMVKYRQRNGWTHADTLRLAHPNPVNTAQGMIFQWVTRRDETAVWARSLVPPVDESLALIWAFERVQATEDLSTVLQLIADYNLPREALPTQWLKQAAIWEALLEKMPMTAMIRNLGNMTKCGLIAPNSAAESIVVERLRDAERLRGARVHPLSVLSALRVYAQGHSLKGQGYRGAPSYDDWVPSQRVMDALDEAFGLAFVNVQPANRRMMLSLDVSGSMGGWTIAGVPGLTPRDGAAAMALVTARTEPNYAMTAFQDRMVPLKISARMRLDDVINRMQGLPFGPTDCAQPMLYAMKKGLDVDTFVVYTDNETWHGSIHPVQALRQYRNKTGIDARLVVVGMVSNGFTIADPNDAGMLDVVGFDAAAPGLIAEFARGEL